MTHDAGPIRPLAISALALDLLRDAAPSVRAVHQSGVSIGVAGSADICYMGAPCGGLLPLHVVVRRADLAQLIGRCGDEAEPPQHGIRLDLEGVRVFHLLLGTVDVQSQAARSAVDRVAAWLRQQTDDCGLGEPVAQALAVHGRIRRTLAAVAAGPQGADEALRAMIGRGAGSTPAGDDVLVGALAYDIAAGASQAALVSTMRALKPRFDQLTTAAGATYLRAALQGAFGGDLIAFVRALLHLPADRALALAMRVASHGATSGIDTLLGFVAAHEADRSTGIRAAAGSGRA